MSKIPFKSMKEYKQHLKSKCKKWKIISEGDTFVKIEDEEGYRAYMQAETFSHKDDPSSFEKISFSTVHKPNKKTGHYNLVFEATQLSLKSMENLFIETLNQSKFYVIHKGEQKEV